MNRIRIIDFLTGKQVWKYYKLYDKTQWYTEEKMKAYKLSKLKRLLTHCYENIPYYRSIIEENQIDIRNFDSFEILIKFPLLTKEVIQANYAAFSPRNSSEIRGVKTTQTGGTTGNILFKRNDSITRSSAWGTYKRYEDWMGQLSTDKTLILMGGHVKKHNLKSKIKDGVTAFLEKSVSVDIYDTSDETIEKIIELLQKNNFSLIRSYPQFLYSVAQKLEERGLSFNIKSISTTAEPVIPEHRNMFKKVFNAEVFDQYGSGEIGGIAYECDKHEGLHVTEERVIIETTPTNELIITDLDNFSMPFIRYYNEDQAILVSDRCSCGRQTQMIKQVMGRTCDYVIGVNDQFLHWAYFWHLIFDSEIASKRNLRKFQIIQKSKGSILIRIIAERLSDEEVLFITQDIQNRTGISRIEFKYEDEIENTKTGKYRPVINELLLNNQQ
jgi:phenylacetate-CoA ligase